MKKFKKIILIFIVAITILGMVAFYAPVRNVRQTPAQNQNEAAENYSASLNPVSVSSTDPVSASLKTAPEKDKASFQDMSGFSDLGLENDLINQLGSGVSSSTEDIFNELNQ